jgi:hypothetical protein
MLRRIRQRALRRLGALAACACLAAAGSARAQNDSYNPPVKATEDEVAFAFLAGRYTTPITCKKTDGTVLQLEDAISFKAAPDAGGGNSMRVTFFGVDVAGVEYCYNLVERRWLDRRGTIFVHFRSFNRADVGVSDFRREVARGPLNYWAHRGELQVKGIGTDADPAAARVLTFDGGDSRIVVEGIPAGTDGAKLLADYEARTGAPLSRDRRRLKFRFIAKDGSEFTFYGVDAAKPRK